MSNSTQIALNFFKLVVEGHIEQAYDTYVDMTGVHHNAYFPAGFAHLREGMIQNHQQYPTKKFDVKNTISEGDLVAIHSHVVLKDGDLGIAVVHIMRIKRGKIVEMWDIGQPVLADTSNTDGAF